MWKPRTLIEAVVQIWFTRRGEEVHEVVEFRTEIGGNRVRKAMPRAVRGHYLRPIRQPWNRSERLPVGRRRRK